jgi:hypothetical protein
LKNTINTYLINIYSKKKKYPNIPLRIKLKQPFFDNVERQRFDNCETAKSSPGARHNRSPTLDKEKKILYIS